jgi:hypothetical protein
MEENNNKRNKASNNEAGSPEISHLERSENRKTELPAPTELFRIQKTAQTELHPIDESAGVRNSKQHTTCYASKTTGGNNK